MQNLSTKKSVRFHSSLYRRSLLLVLLITCLPTLLIGIGIYYFGVSRIEKEVNHTNQIQVTQATKILDTYFAQMETLTVKWAFNPAFDINLNPSTINHGYEDVWELYKALSTIKSSTPIIEKAYLYLSDNSILISSEDGITSMEGTQNQTIFASVMQAGQSLFWTDELPPLSGHGLGVALIQKLPRTSGKPDGSLIIYLDQNKLTELMKGVSSENQVDSFLYHQAGDWVLSLNNGKWADSNPKQKTLLLKALQDQKNMDAFTFRTNGESYSLSYEKFSRTNSPWIYVTATSLSQLTKPVTYLYRLILGVSLIALILAAILSLLASRHLYEPIQRLVRVFGGVLDPTPDHHDEVVVIENRWRHLTAESQSLKKRIDEQLPYLREGFLLQLLQGHLHALTEKQLQDRMIRLGWHPEAKRYNVLLIRLLGLTENNRFREGDEHLVSFSASNIINELFEHRAGLEGCVINFQNMTVGLLVLVPEEWESAQLRGELYRLAEEIKIKMTQLLKLNVTQVIGKSTLSVQEVPDAFEEAQYALGYRDLNDRNQIIDMEDILPPTKQGFSYPFEIEKELLHVIRIGDESETERLITNFVQHLEDEGKEIYVRQGMMQLIGILLHALLKWGYGSYEINGLYEQWAQLRETKVMQKWIVTTIIRPYWEEIAVIRSTQEKKIEFSVDRVLNILQEQYANDSLSLEWCSDAIGVNPYTLSKAFKQQTGVNFIDYLTDLRLDKSRQLLTDTDMKINDVACQVGYQPSYFNRIFKKREGITPSQYRKRLESNGLLHS
jgi:AraC-like DNA-binding protein